MVSLSFLLRVQIMGVLLATPALCAQKIYSHGSPTSHEQLMLELINRARANPVAEARRHGIGLNSGLASGKISRARKQPLAFNRRLIAAARDHSRWMLETGRFSHTGVNGSSPSQRAEARGFRLGVAENIETGSNTAWRDRKLQAGEAHAGLFKSPGHRNNLMDLDHSVLGLGMLFNISGGWHVRHTTQKFSNGSTAESGAFIVGVVFDDKNRDNFYTPTEGLRGIEIRPTQGSFYALTSSSGGYAIPIRPLSTRSGIVRVDLPFPVNTPDSWDKAKAHDQRFRAAQITSAPEMEVMLSWSGSRGGLPWQSSLKIKRPELIHYQLIGTDGYFFPRSMVTTSSVKADLVFRGVVPRMVIR